MTRALAFGALLSACIAGCARDAAPAATSSARAAHEPAWRSPLERDHPLVGRIVDPATGRTLGETELFDALARAPAVVIGERHDNPDHHRLQARVIDALVARGRRPAVVFEMLERAQQPTVDAQLQAAPKDADGLARAVDWEHSGWPAFELYRPVFVSVLGDGLPVRAGSLDRARVMAVAREGVSALDPALVRTFALDAALDEPTQAALREEMQDAHCGVLPDAMLDPMVLVQRARDATLASRMHDKAPPDGSVLIAGNGHARTDRGVPSYLLRAYGIDAAAVGLIEVRAGAEQPADYAADLDAAAVLPFDYVWFTPRASDEDHCAELRERFGGHSAPGAQKSGESDGEADGSGGP